MVIRWSEEKESTRSALKWWFWRFLVGFGILWALLCFFVPMSAVIGMHFSDSSWHLLIDYYKQIAHGDIGLPFRNYGEWWEAYLWEEPRHYTWYSFFAWRLLLLPTLLFVGYQFALFVKNPYHLDPQMFGTGREATMEDVEKMGLFNKSNGLFLGLYKKRKMKLQDHRSIFCIGTPGSGKTAGIIIPAILEDNDACMIIHDPKGELAKATSGHRAKLGPVFMLNWMGKDDTEKGIRWPSWNPIGGGNLPPLHAGREGYLDDLISYLIPDGPSGTDPYWVKTGRGCLTGIAGYLCGKVEQAKANDYFLSRLQKGELDEDDYAVLESFYQSMRDFPEVQQALKIAQERKMTLDAYLPIGKWGIIPESWRGKDACFAMLLDIINNAQIQFSALIAKMKKEGNPNVANMDPWQKIFEDIVLETAYYGYGRRTLLELNQVLSLPDKQRGSVISMALSGVNLFKNSAVRCRTSLNDFNYNQLRGMKDPVTGKYKPVTLYLSVPYADLKASVLLSSLFINMASGALMESGPGEGDMGPFPMTFVLDEFQHMPSLDSIKEGIVFGRDKKNRFIVSVQDWHQIVTKYNKETSDLIMSSVAARLIKRQNNLETRGPLLKGISTLTKVIHDYSGSSGWMDFTGPIFPGEGAIKKPLTFFEHKYGHKIKTKADGVIGGSGILSMAPEKHLLLYSGHLSRPIRALTPLFFKNAEYKALASIKPAPKMPDNIVRKADEMATVGAMQVDIPTVQ